MEIKYFRLIKTIAEEGSIANSTHKLFLTQSALSHQLKDLEQQLGFKVFHRTRNKWSLTDEGHALNKTGCEILERLEKGFATIKQLQQGSAGHIKVSTECYSFYQGLPNFTQKMALLYPNITLELILEATHQPISKLLSNAIDIAVVTAQPHHKLLSSFNFFEDEIYAVMHNEHRLAHREFLDASDFEQEHLIIHSFPLETVSIYEHFLKPNRVVPAKISAIPLTEVALEMIHANFGMMCMPKWALTSFKLPKELAFKRIGKNGLKRYHFLVIRSADTSKKYIQDFISNFKEMFSF